MSAVHVGMGCIFHWAEYRFPDGESADKFLVFVGVKQGCNYLAVVATSKKRNRDFVPGCNAKSGYYHIPGGGKNFFQKDTWLLIADPKEIAPAVFLKHAMKGDIQLRFQLQEQIANAIRNCIKASSDVSQILKDLL